MNTNDHLALPGEGEVRMILKTRCRHECEVCGEPADYRHSFLLENARRNPASSAYGRDDCSWCSDAETFVCEEHKQTRNAPDGHSWAGTFTIAKMPHMGLYWREVEAPSSASRDAEVQRLREALQMLHDDIAEYARINNLGGFDNHCMKQARAALQEQQ